jgi:hypothetical protein
MDWSGITRFGERERERRHAYDGEKREERDMRVNIVVNVLAVSEA